MTPIFKNFQKWKFLKFLKITKSNFQKVEHAHQKMLKFNDLKRVQVFEKIHFLQQIVALGESRVWRLLRALNWLRCTIYQCLQIYATAYSQKFWTVYSFLRFWKFTTHSGIFKIAENLRKNF